MKKYKFTTWIVLFGFFLILADLINLFSFTSVHQGILTAVGALFFVLGITLDFTINK